MPGIVDFLKALATGQAPPIPGQPPVMGNDLPSQGGITGTMDRSQDPYSVGIPQFGGQPNSVMNSPQMNPTNPVGEDPNNPPYGDIGGRQPFPAPPMSGGDQPGFESAIPQYPMGQGPGGENDIMALMNSMYTPEHSAYDRLNQMIDQYPQHEKPSIMRRIGAGIAGFGGGPDDADKFLNAPFDRKLKDWQEKLKPVEQSATLERYNNANERQMASSEAQRVLTQREGERRERRDADLRVKESDRTDIMRKNAETRDYLARHKGYALVREVDAKGTGHWWAVNKSDPTDKFDTGLLDGQVDQLTLQESKNNAAMERTNAQVEGAQTRAETAKPQILNIEDPENPGHMIAVRERSDGTLERVTLNKKQVGAAAKPSGAGNKGGAASDIQEKTRRYNVAQAAALNPDWKPFIQLGAAGSNTFKVVKPPEGKFFGAIPPDAAKVKAYEGLLDHLRKNGIDPMSPTGGGSNDVGSDQIKVIAPDGTPGSIPRANLQKALAQGYKQVQ